MLCPHCKKEIITSKEINGNRLNFNDLMLLELLEEKNYSVNEIAKKLNICAKNISVRLPRLSNLKLISITKLGKGKKTIITKYKK